MIHDATGKFSSRCVLPDRNSLAVVIKNWLHSSGHGDFACAGTSAHADRSRAPYRGIRGQNQCFLRLPQAAGPQPEPAAAADDRTRRAALLPVVFQHLIAGLGYLGTILLQARQNGEIALIDHRAAEALHVARASLLLLRRAAALRGCWAMAPVETDSDNRMSARKNLRIVFLRSDGREFRSRIAHGVTGTDLFGLQAPRTAAASEPEALVNAAKFTAARPEYRRSQSNSLVL